LKAKIDEYQILPQNTFNMDEKGFGIGLQHKSRRIFTKASLESGSLNGSGQDGNREWVTLIATICQDGSALPPFLIYSGQSGHPMSTWLEEFDPDHQDAHFSVSPTGWTNNQLALEWIRRTFEPRTKAKARQGRDFRLILLDGHASHVSIPFVDYCLEHRIILSVFPPHSTHRLQPLDVGLFGPLASYYSSEQGKLAYTGSKITKRMFFKMFWSAFTQSFTEENILGSFRKTGLLPFDPKVVLMKISGFKSVSFELEDVSENTVLTQRHIRREMLSTQDPKLKQALGSALSMKAQNELLDWENMNLKLGLKQEKARRMRGKALADHDDELSSSGPLIYTPGKVKRFRELEAQKAERQAEETRQKQAAKAEKARQKEENRVASEQRKAARLIARQEKQAEQAAKKAQKQAEREVKRGGRQLVERLGNLQGDDISTAKQSADASEVVIAEDTGLNADCGGDGRSRVRRQRRLPVRFRDT
jgi:cell division septum initiation protein DivIVA